MNVILFLISKPSGRDDFSTFTSRPGVRVSWVDTTGCADGIWAAVYYQTVEELADRERVKLTAHTRIANECSASQEYNMMPTRQARERWLLAEWGICSSDAREIIELSDDATDNKCSNAGVSE